MNDKPSPQVIMVEASAGSGKTYALAGHYLKLILNENTRTSVIRDILAITFTKQAAREMKERIFEFLKRIVFDDFKDDTERKEFFANILPETPVNMPEIKKRAVSAIEYIIRNYNYFQVQTIDSFMNMLLAGCSFLVGLSAQFRIKERHREYLGYSLDKIIDNALKDASLRRVFDLFLKQYLFVENKTQWLPKKSILDVLDSMLYHLSVYGKNYTRYGIESSWIFKQRSDILSMLNTMRSGMPEGTKANLVNALDKLLDEDSEYLNLKIFADSKTLQSPEYPAKKGTVLPETLKSLWTDYRQSLERLATEESLSIFNCYAELFEKASVVFEEYAAKEDTVFLSELNSRARGLIKDSGITAPELYLRLAGVYKHFLVDEFQDTSVLRWENLSDMVRNALSAGGSLFCVGDKKQAIFRFSGGDVSLGKKISGELSEFSPQARGLKDNYRSHKHIVEFNNNLFSQENISVFLESLKPEKESDFKYLADYDARYILDVFSNVKQDHLPEKDWGHVSIKELAYNVKEDKNEKLKIEIAEKALELSKRHPRGEIAFLCRTNSEVELVSGWLVESGFSVESEKTLDIRNNFVVREIISFLKFLNSPIDNLSFAAFILGDVFSSRADCGREKVRNFVFTARLAHKKYERYYIYREFRERFESLWEEYIEEFFKSANFLGVYELAASVIDKFDILRSFPEKQGFIMHLLELIKLKEDEYKTLGEFLEYFDSSEDDEKSFYLNPSAHNSIKVLTIHRSKGLSFDAVVVPFVEISVSDLSASGKRGKSQYALLHNENNMSLIKLDRKYAVLSEHIQKVYMSEYRKAVVDELCALYVAFTRPRVELHIILPVAQKNKKNHARALFPSALKDFGSPEKLLEAVKQADDYINLDSLNIWTRKIIEPVRDAGEFLNRSKLKDGSILHYMLACLPEDFDGKSESIIGSIKEKAKLKFPSCGNIESLAYKAEKLIAHEKTKDIFVTKGGLVFSEKEYVDESGNLKRFDRVIIRENEVWVVDYKTNLDDIKQYAPQMKSYTRIAQGVYPDKKVRAFLVSIENPEIVEL